jgi:hypothetical protein
MNYGWIFSLRGRDFSEPLRRSIANIPFNGVLNQ